jgi:hypothetical protein
MTSAALADDAQKSGVRCSTDTANRKNATFSLSFRVAIALAFETGAINEL